MTQEERDNLLLSMNEKLNINTDILKEHDIILKELKEISKEHDLKLKGHSSILKEHDLTLKELKEILKNHDSSLKELKEISKNHDSSLKELKQISKNHDEYIKQNEREHEIILDELKRIRQNIARLENDVLDKIGALFDAHEVNSDKIKDNSNKINSMKQTLDMHNSRLLKLELT